MPFKLKLTFLILCLFVLIGCDGNYYTITFENWDGEVIKENKLIEGKTIVAPVVPLRDGYRFVGWDQEFDKVTGDLVIKALFEKSSFKVCFYDDRGTLLKEEDVDYGLSATPPVVEMRDNQEFSHWDKSFDEITADLDVIAVYKELMYLVDFYDGSTKLALGLTDYVPNTEVELPIPTKDGYAFAGWFLSEISLYEVNKIDSSLKGNLKLYSRWVKTDQANFVAPIGAIEFVRVNKNPHSSGVGFVYQPQLPAGANASVLQYDWASSNPKVATISAYSSISIASPGYAIITGTLKTDPSIVYYGVIQTSADGVVLSTIEEANALNYVEVVFKMSESESISKIVQKGSFVVAPTAPFKEGYVFTGWFGENEETIYNITKETIFVPTYELGFKDYAGKTISVLGDSISTYEGYIPSGFAHFYPYPTADLSDVNQTWWMQFINAFGMNLLINNSWSGSAVAGGATSATTNPSRLNHLYIGDVKPDVILIFMGANDAASQYIDLTDFDTAYNEMLTKIKTSSPTSEIILCTLPSLPLYTQANQESYNGVIRKYAGIYQTKLIDFELAFPRGESSQYLVDSAHPNKLGMDTMAGLIISEFKEQNKSQLIIP